MPDRHSRDDPQTPLPVLVDPDVARALSDVVRQHILLAATQRPVSTAEMSAMFGVRPNYIGYHVNALRKGCGGLLEREPGLRRRGAIEHLYRASVKTLLPANAWHHVKEGIRTVVGARMANDLFEDLAAAVTAGTLEGPNSYVFRSPLILDAAGGRAVKEIAERAAREIEEAQQASAARVARARSEEGVAHARSAEGVATYTFGATVFESANSAVPGFPGRNDGRGSRTE